MFPYFFTKYYYITNLLFVNVSRETFINFNNIVMKETSEEKYA